MNPTIALLAALLAALPCCCCCSVVLGERRYYLVEVDDSREVYGQDLDHVGGDLTEVF